MPAANWRRPEYYAVAERTRAEAIAEEVRAVRHRIGLIDVGTLGKIEVHGPHAGEFLERVYTTRFANLKPGMTRYGLMLDEAGTIIDDGVIARLRSESCSISQPPPAIRRRSTANSRACRPGGACPSAW